MAFEKEVGIFENSLTKTQTKMWLSETSSTNINVLSEEWLSRKWVTGKNKAPRKRIRESVP